MLEEKKRLSKTKSKLYILEGANYEHKYSNIPMFWATNKYLYSNSYLIDIRIDLNIHHLINIYLQIFSFLFVPVDYIQGS